MGDPLPHDERIGQVIYNALRPDGLQIHSNPKLVEQQMIREKATIADKLFNLPDHELQRLFIDRLWCEKCKKGDRLL